MVVRVLEEAAAESAAEVLRRVQVVKQARQGLCGIGRVEKEGGVEERGRPCRGLCSPGHATAPAPTRVPELVRRRAAVLEIVREGGANAPSRSILRLAVRRLAVRRIILILWGTLRSQS